MGQLLRVLIADDHPLFLFAIAHSVSSREELELVGQARTGREAIATALETRPDLAVLDARSRSCASSPAACRRRRSPRSCTSRRRRSRRISSGCTSGWACPIAPPPVAEGIRRGLIE